MSFNSPHDQFSSLQDALIKTFREEFQTRLQAEARKIAIEVSARTLDKVKMVLKDDFGASRSITFEISIVEDNK
jgi:hypothetical protein